MEQLDLQIGKKISTFRNRVGMTQAELPENVREILLNGTDDERNSLREYMNMYI